MTDNHLDYHENPFPKVTMEDILDIKSIQELMDDFYDLTGFGVAFIDTEGKVLVSTGWQRVYAEFQRMDISTPIIVGDWHIGNLFLGQFFFEDEVIDWEFYKQQAKKYSFPEDEYLNALKRIPIWKRETVTKVVSFYQKLCKQITELSYAKYLVKKQEEHLEIAHRVAGIGHWNFDLRRKKIYWSKDVFLMLGYTPFEFEPTYEHFLKSVYFEDRELVDERFRSSIKLKQDYYELEHRVLDKDGHFRYLLQKCEHIKDSSGRIIYSEGMTQDITERKNRELLLQKSEERYKSLFEDNNSVMLLIEREGGKIWDVNSSASRYYGWSREEMREMNIRQINTLSPEEIKIQMSRASNGEQNKFTFKHRLSNGEVRNVEVFSGPINVDNTELLYSIVHDVTDRVKAEMEINEVNQKLKKSLEEKDMFYSIIAHDLKSPLASLMTGTKIIAQNFSNLKLADIQSLAKNLEQTSSNLYRLLVNLLNWSQMQQGAMVFVPEQLNLKNIVNSSISVLKEYALSKEIGINIEIPQEIEVCADNNMIQSVFRNLVSNAIKYSPRGESILVKATKQNGVTTIVVSDNGIGMSNEILDGLFKINPTHGRAGTEGELSTGLGLVLCKEFINRHNGRIYAQSEVNRGSSFIIELN